MTVEELPRDRLLETLAALRAAARFRAGNGKRHFAHMPLYRAAFVKGILERRRLLRNEAE